MNIETPGNETNPPLTNMSTNTSEDSSYANKSEAKFEIAGPEITLVNDLMGDADYNEEIIPNEPPKNSYIKIQKPVSELVPLY